MSQEPETPTEEVADEEFERVASEEAEKLSSIILNRPLLDVAHMMVGMTIKERLNLNELKGQYYVVLLALKMAIQAENSEK